MLGYISVTINICSINMGSIDVPTIYLTLMFIEYIDSSSIYILILIA